MPASGVATAASPPNAGTGTASIPAADPASPGTTVSGTPGTGVPTSGVPAATVDAARTRTPAVAAFRGAGTSPTDARRPGASPATPDVAPDVGRAPATDPSDVPDVASDASTVRNLAARASGGPSGPSGPSFEPVADRALAERAAFDVAALGSTAGADAETATPVAAQALAAARAAGAPAAGALGGANAGATGAATSTPIALEADDAHASLGATVRSLVQGGGSIARLDVTPADLGPLSIEIERGPDRLGVVVQAANPAARDLLDALLPRLREMLAADGFGDVRASVGDDPRQEARQQNAQAGREPGQATSGGAGRDAGQSSGQGPGQGASERDGRDGRGARADAPPDEVSGARGTDAAGNRTEAARADAAHAVSVRLRHAHGVGSPALLDRWA